MGQRDVVLSYVQCLAMVFIELRLSKTSIREQLIALKAKPQHIDINPVISIQTLSHVSDATQSKPAYKLGSVKITRGRAKGSCCNKGSLITHQSMRRSVEPIPLSTTTLQDPS